MALNIKITLLVILFLFVIVYNVVVAYKQLKNQQNNVNSDDAFKLFMKMSPYRWFVYTFFLKDKTNKYNPTTKKED